MIRVDFSASSGLTIRHAAQATVAAAKWLAAGAPLVDESTHLARSVECSLCPLWDAHAGRCLQCGCYGIKLWLATETCPLHRW
jgi:hypothetical protein